MGCFIFGLYFVLDFYPSISILNMESIVEIIVHRKLLILLSVIIILCGVNLPQIHAQKKKKIRQLLQNGSFHNGLIVSL